MNDISPAQGPAKMHAIARDGTRLAYRLVRGRGRKRLVLVHPLAMAAELWDDVVAALAGEADVLLWDCRGHAASDKPEGPYRVELFACDLRDVMNHVGWTDAVIAGASMGGCVALAFAGAFPERVSGLGLIDTTDWYGPAAPEQWRARGQTALTEGMSALTPFQTSRWFGDAFRAANPSIVAKAVEIFLANDPAAYARVCDMLGAADLREVLPGLDMPVRILVGEEDYATPVAMAEAMQARISGASLLVIPGARHFTPLECPALIADELRALLASAQAG